MLGEMTCREFDEWLAYYSVAPWGPERDSLHAGIIASAAVAPHCKANQAPKPKDFMPDFIDPPKQGMSLANMKAQWKTAMGAFNRKAKP
jgi:hypothetical protein